MLRFIILKNWKKSFTGGNYLTTVIKIKKYKQINKYLV